MATTHFVWDEPTDNILVEADAAGAANAWYTNETGLYGSLVSQLRDGQAGFQHFDCQGSTRELTDAVGSATGFATYAAFGAMRGSSGEVLAPFAFGGAFGYYGSGFDYSVRRRPFDTQQGRWLTVDPAGYAIGANRYLYSSNCPVVRIDPSGLADCNCNELTTFPVAPSCEPCCDPGGCQVTMAIPNIPPATTVTVPPYYVIQQPSEITFLVNNPCCCLPIVWRMGRTLATYYSTVPITGGQAIGKLFFINRPGRPQQYGKLVAN